jgi:hypothetical protein
VVSWVACCSILAFCEALVSARWATVLRSEAVAVARLAMASTVSDTDGRTDGRMDGRTGKMNSIVILKNVRFEFKLKLEVTVEQFRAFESRSLPPDSF